MPLSSIDAFIRSSTLAKGFSRVRFISPYDPQAFLGARVSGDNHWQGAPSLLMAALPYGNLGVSSDQGKPSTVAPFARRNYYAEAVARLKEIARELRERWGGSKSDYRILCNSPVPEKPLALRCGLGWLGKNSLIITPEAGSLVVIASMTVPFPLPPDSPLPGVFPSSFNPCLSGPFEISDLSFPACKVCGDQNACSTACPTGALDGSGVLCKEKCIQWYASGNGEKVPDFVAQVWGERLYGCSNCQDSCPHNKKSVDPVETERGKLPDCFSAEWLLAAGDEEIRAVLKGTALGLQWLGPQSLRRNAELAARHDAALAVRRA
ncbi:epoxyqueuosine reductase [Gracilinema caldarium]|uniref:epoxyqueuosine reductase n=1 Tax=Gracilinema caldarium TaxID=215591 RepID=UPI0026EECF37|nr:4Fe-4S double cluster binding domain-containing protein [Gracilinema caldarium]